MKKILVALCAIFAASFIQSVIAEEADPRISVALSRNDIKFQVNDSNNFRVICITDKENNRDQLVIVNSKTEKYASLELREIWALGYKVPEGSTVPAPVVKKAMSSSDNYKLGFWELSENEDILFHCARVPANLDDDTLIKVIFDIAGTADEFEAENLGTDEL